MPRRLADYQRQVERIKALRAKGKITPQEATRLLEKERLKYQAYAIRFEQQPRGYA